MKQRSFKIPFTRIYIMIGPLIGIHAVRDWPRDSRIMMYDFGAKEHERKWYNFTA